MPRRLIDLLLVVLLLGSITQAVTPQHPGHAVLLNRLDAGGAVNGQYLRFDAPQGWHPVDGVGIPIFVDNATLNPVAGLPSIQRNLATGELTLPSAPFPQRSLKLSVNGLTQAFGIDYTLNGVIATPAAANVALYKEAIEIVASYRQ